MKRSLRVPKKVKKKPPSADMSPDTQKIQKMTVAQLKAELAKYGIEPKGLKADLINQLTEHVSQNSMETSNENNSSKKRKATTDR